MGTQESKERALFIDISKRLLENKGVSIGSSQLKRFFHFIQECSPWFPESGSFDLKTWKKVGDDMHIFYRQFGDEKIPRDAFALWNLFRDCFDSRHEAEQLRRKLKSPLSTASYQKEDEKGKQQVIAVAENVQEGKNESESDSDSDSAVDEKNKLTDKLSPSDEEDLEEAAFKYHNEDYPPFLAPVVTGRPRKKSIKPLPNRVGFLGAVAEAQQQGDLSICCPVIWAIDDDGEPQWEPLSFKIIKELRTAVRDLGPTSPYAVQLVENIGSRWLTPFDWQQTAKSCLTPGQYLLWKTEYEEQAKSALQSQILKGTRGREKLILGQRPMKTIEIEGKKFKGLLDTGADVTSFFVGASVTRQADPIIWKSNHPVWVEQWPLSKEKLEAATKLVQEQLEQGHIEPSNSPWNTPIFVIKKKSDKWRLLQDLRAVNNTMETMGALQPGLPSPVAVPKGYNIVVIDLQDCFFTIPLAEQDRWRFAFSLPSPNLQRPYQRFQWKVLPQGMKNSPTLCQKFVDQALLQCRQKYPECYIIHYMDDILLAHYQTELLQQALAELVKDLQQWGLIVAPEKIQQEPPYNYLGRTIKTDYIMSQKLQIRKDKLVTLNDFQKLLGDINWIRPF
ncbi:PREDICTED: uncharacterized protein LOC103583026 [Galeopterus variegatus]|uniref:Uncharacterized protein LOC103583026 n=1 Tax=Galeopterus variegatus TaxID=482537 RepID=A0ABM0Q2T4_GALVR|nr:PREDICTED: uncharacterized protein LOC103583026 [Galeopterus variegatus]